MSAQQQIADFQKYLSIVPCVKTSVPQLIGFYGNSGGGKTVTALVCLIGMVGPKVKIGVTDTENRRAGVAADVVKAMCLEHYREAPEIAVVNLEPPFHPLKYVAALEALRKAGCGAYLVDSMSHAWNGTGGYLDLKEEALDRMAGNDWQKREKCAMAAAAQTKPHTHAKLVNAILQIKAPTVLCFRSKDKTTISRDGGKTKIETDSFGTPIQEATMIYEMLVSGEVSARDGIGGYCSFRGDGPKKTTHPAILKLLPQDGEQFGFGHGKALADWCSAPGSSQVAPQSAPAPSQAPQAPLPLSSPAQEAKAATAPAQATAPAPVASQPIDPAAQKALINELWQITAPYRPAEEKQWTSTRQWLWDQNLMAPDQITIKSLTIEQLTTMIEAIKAM